jgi:hypothetical protein
VARKPAATGAHAERVCLGFSDVWQAKDLAGCVFVSMAAKGLTGALFGSMALKGVSEFARPNIGDPIGANAFEFGGISIQ